MGRFVEAIKVVYTSALQWRVSSIKVELELIASGLNPSKLLMPENRLFAPIVFFLPYPFRFSCC